MSYFNRWDIKVDFSTGKSKTQQYNQSKKFYLYHYIYLIWDNSHFSKHPRSPLFFIWKANKLNWFGKKTTQGFWVTHTLLSTLQTTALVFLLTTSILETLAITSNHLISVYILISEERKCRKHTHRLARPQWRVSTRLKLGVLCCCFYFFFFWGVHHPASK